jgi:serine/threonine protein kinase
MGNKQKESTINNHNSKITSNNKSNNFGIDNSNDKTMLINRNHFDSLYPIGRGGFGKVWKVCHKKTKRAFAMKEMSKAKIIDKRSERSIKAERELLSQMQHPFIVNIHYAFQDSSNIYLVMDLLTGGDMRYHISKMNHKKTLFNEEQASK